MSVAGSMERTTSVLARASTYALADLATVRDELDIPPSDAGPNARLSRYIAQSSADIARHCGRVFPVEALREVFRFGYCERAHELMLSRDPVAGFVTLKTASAAAAGATALTLDLGPVEYGVTLPISLTTLPPVAGTQIIRVTVGATMRFSAALAGSVLTAASAATGTVILDIALDGTNFATAIFPASATTAIFSGIAVGASAGSVVTMTPRTNDATLELLSGYLTGTVAALSPGGAAPSGIVPIAYTTLPPTAGAQIVRQTLGADVRFPAGLAGSVLTAAVAATADTTLDVALDGVNFATAIFPASATTAIFSGIAVGASAGSVVTMIPRRSDATLELLSGYLAGADAMPRQTQPVSGLGIAPETTVRAAAGVSVTLSTATVADVPAGTPITFGLAVYFAGGGQTLILDTDYVLNTGAGLLTRLCGDRPTGWGSTQTVVLYSAGYDPIPADVQAECIDRVKAMNHGRGRDPLLKVRDGDTYGRQEFWLGSLPYGSRLDRYVRPAIG